MDNNIFEGESYCDFCLPDNIDPHEVHDGDGEQDSPAHCCGCGRPVQYTLTPDGINYVLEAIKESIRRKEPSSNAKIPSDGWSYYAGLPAYAVVRDWAEDLLAYGITVKQRNLVIHFLSITEPS